MPSHIRALLSLPEDVLLEILAHLLVDTPRSRHRAAILQTCSTLHHLGLPLLHQVIDLQGHATLLEMFASWETLFGQNGTLSNEDRFPGLNRSVRELRIGSRRRSSEDEQVASNSTVDICPTDLPRCTVLILDRTYVGPLFRAGLAVFIASLPITDFSFVLEHNFGGQRYVASTVGRSFLSFALGFDDQPSSWRELNTLRFCGSLWYEFDDTGLGGFVSRIACSAWHFKVLIVSVKERPNPATLEPSIQHGHEKDLAARFVDMFADPIETPESDNWWKGLHRIELRIPTWLEADLQLRTDELRKDCPLARLQRRILPMVVFVDADGKEKRLIPEEEKGSLSHPSG